MKRLVGDKSSKYLVWGDSYMSHEILRTPPYKLVHNSITVVMTTNK